MRLTRNSPKREEVSGEIWFGNAASAIRWGDLDSLVTSKPRLSQVRTAHWS